MSDSVQLHQLTRREFRERMASGDLRLCIIPIAAIEQHLEHMAMEHDWRSVNVVAGKVAETLSPQVLVAGGIKAGISEHHMTHPGTLTLRPATFLAALNDMVRSVVMAGFENVLVLNGHGGNVAPIGGVWDQFLREFRDTNLHFMSYWDVYTVDDARDLLDSGERLPQDLPGHAQEFETSFGLAEFPENVRTDMLTDQSDPMPAMATAAKGEAFVERAVERLVKIAGEIISGERQSELPPFHP